MRILNVNHLLDPVNGGGTAERTIQITRSILQKNVDCEILALAINEVDIYEKKLPKIHWLPCINQRFFIPLVRLGQLNKLISEFDVVHLMGHWTILNAIVALICIFQSKPYVVCPAGALKNFGRSQWLKRLYDLVIGKNIIRSASGWVAITEDEKLDFINYGIDPKLIVTIPNGVNPDNYQINNKQSVADERLFLNGQPYILFLGRLNSIKGPDLLIEAFWAVTNQFSSMHLVLAGPDAGLMASLKNKVASLGIEHLVHFAGYVDGEKKLNALRFAEFLVIPSREEAMSIVVLEAGMCSTPVIFTDRCGLSELVNYDAGIQVEAKVDSIKKGIIKALESPDEMKMSGIKLNQVVLNKFLWEKQANLYKELYSEILNKNKFKD